MGKRSGEDEIESARTCSKEQRKERDDVLYGRVELLTRKDINNRKPLSGNEEAGKKVVCLPIIRMTEA